MNRPESPPLWQTVCRLLPGLIAILACAQPALAAGTLAGTDISNTASVSYELDGTPVSQDSNTVTITVVETLDLTLVLQTAQTPVIPGSADQVLIYTLTNTGNGPEQFTLSTDNSDAGDDFDPVVSAPYLYFDSDGSGDLSAGDTAYVPGNNDPLLDPDSSITLFLLNDIPAGLANGDVGRSALIVAAVTGSGTPGTIIAGAGSNGVNAVVGSSGAQARITGEYVVSDVQLDFVKSATVSDPNGGNEPVPGATILYQIRIEVIGTGTAAALIVSDPIPLNTSYVAGSLELNGAVLSDQSDADAGAYDGAATPPQVTVRLGDLQATDGAQTIEFAVLID